MLPIDGSIEARYADGYVLSETELGDVSPYQSNENVLRCILKGDPEAEHGPMVEFSAFWRDNKYSVDWRQLPDNARPVRFKHMQMLTSGNEILSRDVMSLEFGYQFTDKYGRNVQQVMELDNA